MSSSFTLFILLSFFYIIVGGDRDYYMLLGSGRDGPTCGGYNHLTESECSSNKVVNSLGLNSYQTYHNNDQYPRKCYKRSNNKAYYNRDSSSDTDCSSDDQCICKWTVHIMYKVQWSGSCNYPIGSASACQTAASRTPKKSWDQTVDTSSKASGCIFSDTAQKISTTAMLAKIVIRKILVYVFEDLDTTTQTVTRRLLVLAVSMGTFWMQRTMQDVRIVLLANTPINLGLVAANYAKNIRTKTK